MTEPEIDDAFDELFVGANPPATLSDALARLPAEARTRIANDDEARRTLADLVWLSNALKSKSPQPSVGFAERATNAVYQTGRPDPSWSWRSSTAGIAIAAMLLFAVGLVLMRPAGNGNAPELAKVEPAPQGELPAFALFSQVKKLTPSLSGEQSMLASIARSDIASFAIDRETGPLAKTIAGPAENLATVGKKIEMEVRPLRKSVREAFAFLGDFPVREKKSL